jgi:flagellar biosynthesis chaperone FliJ
MSVVSDFRNEFKRFGTYDPGSEKYTDGAAYKFDQACQHAKVDVDEILADLIITSKEVADRTDAEIEKNNRIESLLIRDYTPSSGTAFNTSATRDEKLDWVKKHLTLDQKIMVLSEVQALESIVDGTNPYPDDVFKARKQRSDAKKDCSKNAEKLKERYQDFLTRLDAKIKEDASAIDSKNKAIDELAKGVAGKETEAKVTTEAAARIKQLQDQIAVIQKELNALRSLRDKASAQVDIFIASIDNSLRENKIFEKDEKKDDDKTGDKPSGSSIKSPYSSLSDRGKQASDSQEAKDLYQSFAAADKKSKFLMLTGLDARNMLEIARNLANVGDRKDLQEYCKKLLDSENYITYNGTTLDGFTITTSDGRTIDFPALSKAKLKEGLLEYDADQIGKLFEALNVIKLKDLSVENLAKLQNYSNALLISTTLQEAKWGKGKQITKGWLHLPGRKKDPYYDLAVDVATFMRPLQERKDKIFKDINKEVDKGIDSNDHIKYGQNTAVQHGQRKYNVRTFDER